MAKCCRDAKDTRLMAYMGTPLSLKSQRVPLPRSLSLYNGNIHESREDLPFSSWTWAIKGRGKAVSKERWPGSVLTLDADMGVSLGVPLHCPR